MNKLLNNIVLLLVVLVLSIYITQEITVSKYTKQLDDIQIIKDSLELKTKEINTKLIIKDSILKHQVKISKELILKITKNIKIDDEAINAYDQEIDAIINEL